MGHIWPARSFCAIDFLMERLTQHFLRNKKVQTKPFFCLVLPKSLRICGEDLFFLVFTYFLGLIPEILAKVSTDFVLQTCNYLEFNLAKMHVARNNFSPVNVARTSKKVGQPCIKRKPIFSPINYSFNFCCSLKAKSILEVSKTYKGRLP